MGGAPLHYGTGGGDKRGHPHDVGGKPTLTRRAFGLMLGAGALQGAKAPAPREALRKAIGYLWRRQSADGGWRSRTYGLLGSGQSMTAFVLNALLRNPGQPQERVDRALAFLERNINSEGGVGRTDPLLDDYPAYATSLAVSAFARAGRTGWRERAAPMVGYLRSRQFTEENGWRPEDAPYGAWGMGGDIRTPPNPGHVDLSMTRHALEALAGAGVAAGDPAFQKAGVFLQRCRNADGGFFFSTVVLDANKAGPDGTGYRSYGTATADALLSLRATGVADGDEQVVAARRWITAHYVSGGASGFVGQVYQRWTAGLRFYYAAAAAEALRDAEPQHNRWLADELRRAQRADGSWVNPEPLVKEDDPLIATAFAVIALS